MEEPVYARARRVTLVHREPDAGERICEPSGTCGRLKGSLYVRLIRPDKLGNLADKELGRIELVQDTVGGLTALVEAARALIGTELLKLGRGYVLVLLGEYLPRPVTDPHGLAPRDLMPAGFPALAGRLLRRRSSRRLIPGTRRLVRRSNLILKNRIIDDVPFRVPLYDAAIRPGEHRRPVTELLGPPAVKDKNLLLGRKRSLHRTDIAGILRNLRRTGWNRRSNLDITPCHTNILLCPYIRKIQLHPTGRHNRLKSRTQRHKCRR